MAGFSMSLCVGVVASAAALHPYHVAIGEAELNEAGDRLEVALMVFPEDLERALSLASGAEVDLETTENVDELIAEYTAMNWLWREAGADEPEGGWPGADLVWVGKELKPRECWLYFTVGVPGDLAELELSLTVLFEVEPTQENSLSISGGEADVSVTFTAQDPWQRPVPGTD